MRAAVVALVVALGLLVPVSGGAAVEGLSVPGGPGGSGPVLGSVPVADGQRVNGAPVVDVSAWRYEGFVGEHRAPRGVLVFKYFDGVFSDPDGDELAYTAEVTGGPAELVSALAVRVRERPKAGYRHLLFFEADAGADWSAVPNPARFEVTLTATDPGGLSASVSGVFVTSWEQPAVPVNGAPVVDVSAWRYEGFVGEHRAPRGVLVFKYFDGVFSDPDGDELAYTAEVTGGPAELVSALAVRVRERPKAGYRHLLFFEADAGADWSAVPNPARFEVTLTATDPGGLSASVSGVFVTRRELAAAPVLTASGGGFDAGGAAVVTLGFDQMLQAVPGPGASQFSVRVFSDPAGPARTVAVSSVQVRGSQVRLSLASPPVPGEFVTVDYAHRDASPLVRAGGSRPVTDFSGGVVLMLLAAAQAQAQEVSADDSGAGDEQARVVRLAGQQSRVVQSQAVQSRTVQAQTVQAQTVQAQTVQAQNPHGRFAVLYEGTAGGAEAARCPAATGLGDNVAARWSAHCASVSRPGNRAAYFVYTPAVDEFLEVTVTSPDAVEELVLWEAGRAVPVDRHHSGTASCLARCAYVRHRVTPGTTYVIEVTGRGAAAGGRFLLGVRSWTLFDQPDRAFVPNGADGGEAVDAACRADLGRIDYPLAELWALGGSRPNGWAYGDGRGGNPFAWPCHSVERAAVYARYFTFSVAEARNVRIEAYGGNAAGTRLTLRPGTATSGENAVHSHSPGQPVQARIDARLQPGTYTVEGAAAGPGNGGAFDLAIRPGPEPWTPPAECRQDIDIDIDTPGGWWGGTIGEPCRSAARPGSYARWYTFTIGGDDDFSLNTSLFIRPNAPRTLPADAWLTLREGRAYNGLYVAYNDDKPDWPGWGSTWGINDSQLIAQDLAPGTYTIEATTRWPDQTGPYSLAASARGPITAPGKATNVMVNRHATDFDKLEVSWTLPAVNPDAPVTAVVLEVTQGVGTIVLDGRPTSHTLTGLAQNTAYLVTVKTRNAAGDTAAAQKGASTVGLLPPNQPSNVRATAKAGAFGEIGVEWHNGATSLERPRSAVVVFWTPASPDGTNRVDLDDADADTYTITGLADNTSYTVSVASQNDIATGIPVSATAVTTPDRPLRVWFSGDTPKLSLGTSGRLRAFTQVSTNKTSTALCSISTGAGNSINCPPDTLVSLGALQSGTVTTRPPALVTFTESSGQFTITGANYAGELEISATATAGTQTANTEWKFFSDVGGPRAPRVAVSAGDNRIRVGWSPPDRLGMKAGNVLSGYQVWIRAKGTTTWSKFPWVGTAANAGSVAERVIEANNSTLTLVDGTTYEVRVRARAESKLNPTDTSNTQFEGMTTGSCTGDLSVMCEVTFSSAIALTKSGPPRNVAVSATGPDSLSVSWDPPADTGGAAVHLYRVRYFKTGQPGTEKAIAVDGRTTSTTITGLDANTSYSVQIQASTAALAFNSDRSAAVSATTPEALAVWFSGDTPTIRITSTQAIVFLQSSTNKPAAVRCQITTVDSINCPTDTVVSIRQVITGRHAVGDVQDRVQALVQEVGVRTGTTITHWDYEGPDCDSVLEIKATATASEGDETATTEHTFFTQVCGPEAPAIAVSAGNGKIAVGWTPPTRIGWSDGSPISLKGYLVQWRSQNADGSWPDWSNSPVLADTVREHEITAGIANGTNVQVRVRARNETTWQGGTWQFSGMTTGSCPLYQRVMCNATPSSSAAAPGAPTGLSVAAGSNAGELNASWTAPASAGGGVHLYRVQYKTTASSAWTDTDVVLVDGNTTSATITGLTGGTAYNVRVRAEGAAGDSGWHATVNGTPN